MPSLSNLTTYLHHSLTSLTTSSTSTHLPIRPLSSPPTTSNKNPDPISQHTSKPYPHYPPYPLHTPTTSLILTLPDGRTLGYAVYGAPSTVENRITIFYNHGIPGSRLEAALFDSLGKELGVQIIGVDRPGMGLSSPKPGWRLLDYPRDLEVLTEALGVERFGVIAMSGGGPSALACAHSLPPSHLKAVTIICGLGPPDISLAGANIWIRLGFSIGFLYAPAFLLRWWWQREPAGRLDLSDDERFEGTLQNVSKTPTPTTAHEKRNLQVWQDENFLRLVLASARESYAQGFEGVREDGRSMCEDWHFRLEDVRKDLPVFLWYGRFDTNVPARVGEVIAERLGGRAKLRVEEETHASLEMFWLREIFVELVESMRDEA